MKRHCRFPMVRNDRLRRMGVTVAESAIVLPVLLLIILSMLDYGLAVLQHNSLSEAARRVARHAIVRGEHASPEMNEWGPNTYEGTADDQTEQGSAIREGLRTIDPHLVGVRIEWPDGDNNVGQKVHVTLTYEYEPIVPFLFLDTLQTLTAKSSMRVAH